MFFIILIIFLKIFLFILLKVLKSVQIRIIGQLKQVNL